MVTLLTIPPLVAVTVILPVSVVGGATVSDSAWFVVTAGTSLSVTLTVKELDPVAMGVPVMAPVDALMLKPAGSTPAVIA